MDKKRTKYCLSYATALTRTGIVIRNVWRQIFAARNFRVFLGAKFAKLLLRERWANVNGLGRETERRRLLEFVIAAGFNASLMSNGTRDSSNGFELSLPLPSPESERSYLEKTM